MRKPLLVLAVLSLAVLVFAQTPGSRQKPAKRLDGVRIEGNKAVALSGYELTKEADNTVSVRKKKKKEPTGSLRCGCTGDGGCTLTVASGSQAICSGQCNGGCTLVVITPTVKPM